MNLLIARWMRIIVEILFASRFLFRFDNGLNRLALISSLETATELCVKEVNDFCLATHGPSANREQKMQRTLHWNQMKILLHVKWVESHIAIGMEDMNNALQFTEMSKQSKQQPKSENYRFKLQSYIWFSQPHMCNQAELIAFVTVYLHKEERKRNGNKKKL